MAGGARCREDSVAGGIAEPFVKVLAILAGCSDASFTFFEFESAAFSKAAGPSGRSPFCVRSVRGGAAAGLVESEGVVEPSRPASGT